MDTTTANVPYIKAQLKRDLDIADPILLNSRFQEILDSNSTRGIYLLNYLNSLFTFRLIWFKKKLKETLTGIGETNIIS